MLQARRLLLARGERDQPLHLARALRPTRRHHGGRKEREILVEGGLLHYLAEHGEQVSGDADGDGEVKGLDQREGEPQREEAEQGAGGKTE